jgi:hypothetical protein
MTNKNSWPPNLDSVDQCKALNVASFARLAFARPSLDFPWERAYDSNTLVARFDLTESDLKMLGTVLLVILILLLLGVLPNWGYSRNWGAAPGGAVGLILIIVVVLLLMGRI